VRLQALGELKNPMTSPGIEPSTFRLVAKVRKSVPFNIFTAHLFAGHYRPAVVLSVIFLGSPPVSSPLGMLHEFIFFIRTYNMLCPYDFP
jgi:hypothetical protein